MSSSEEKENTNQTDSQQKETGNQCFARGPEYEYFDDFGLSNGLLLGIANICFTRPSLIQRIAIPPILRGQDVIIQGQSGTGKTGAFSIGVIQQITEKKCPQAIIISPTRELSTQHYFVVSKLIYQLPLTACMCIGGNNTERENIAEASTSQILIGSPKRIINIIGNSEKKCFGNENYKEIKFFKFVDVVNVKILVFDEADVLLSTNFLEQTQNLLQIIPRTTQICLFSATYTPENIKLTNKFMNTDNLFFHEIPSNKLPLELITQYNIEVTEPIKMATIDDLYKKLKMGQVVIFINTIARAITLKRDLERENHSVGIIHANMSQIDRNEQLLIFRKGLTRVMLSTDIMARGIDISNVSIVINYDIPHDPAFYIHRIGRCGRFGRYGIAINFVTPRDRDKISAIIANYQVKIEKMPNPDVINKLLKQYVTDK